MEPLLRLLLYAVLVAKVRKDRRVNVAMMVRTALLSVSLVRQALSTPIALRCKPHLTVTLRVLSQVTILSC